MASFDISLVSGHLNSFVFKLKITQFNSLLG